MESSLTLFGPDEVERARRYHRPLYLALVLDLTLGLAALSVLAFTRAGSWLQAIVDGLPWWGRALSFPPLVLGVMTLVRLPLSFWRGHVWEGHWGFSTQTAWSWLLDRAKGFAVGAVLSALAVLVFVALARALPGVWPAIAAPGAALLVLALAFAGPIAFEPLFNRFRPLRDAALGQLADLMASNPFAVPAFGGTRTRRAEQVDCVWFDREKPAVAFEVENTTTITDGIVRMTNVEGAGRRVIVIPQARKALMEQKLKEPMLNPEEGRGWTFMFYERVTELLALARAGELSFDGFLDALETEASIEASGQGRLALW